MGTLFLEYVAVQALAMHSPSTTLCLEQGQPCPRARAAGTLRKQKTNLPWPVATSTTEGTFRLCLLPWLAASPGGGPLQLLRALHPGVDAVAAELSCLKLASADEYSDTVPKRNKRQQGREAGIQPTIAPSWKLPASAN